MPSFDVVSEIDLHELRNAVDQAGREISTRFDFKNTRSHFELEDTVVTLVTESEFQLGQMRQILTMKLAKRGVDTQSMTAEKPETALKSARQRLVFRQGIDAPTAKKISKLVKEAKLKVQTAFQGDKIRVTGKKRDDLQQVIKLLREAELGIALQFENFRD